MYACRLPKLERDLLPPFSRSTNNLRKQSYHTKLRHIQEYGTFHTHRRVNLKPQVLYAELQEFRDKYMNLVNADQTEPEHSCRDNTINPAKI